MVDQKTLMEVDSGGRAAWEVAVVEKPRSRAAEILASVPAIVAGAGERAAWRFLEFFTANIRNKNTRRAYAHAVRLFCAWLGDRGINDLAVVNPVLVAAYVEHIGRDLSKPSVKLHLAAIRMLCDYLVTGGILPFNPASSVRGPKYVTKRGKTPVLDDDQVEAVYAGLWRGAGVWGGAGRGRQVR